MSNEIDHERRRFFGAAAMTIAAAQFGLNSSAEAQQERRKTPDARGFKPGTNTTFASLKQIAFSPLRHDDGSLRTSANGSMAGDAVVIGTRLRANSLLTGEFYREICDLEALRSDLLAKTRCAAATYAGIPYSNLQGNISG